MISGLVICRAFLAEEAKSGRVSIPAFYVRRTFRIFPPLFFFLIVVVLSAKTGFLPAEAAGVARAATFTCNWPPPQLHPLICGNWYGGHLWSLSFEEQFYLVFPFVFIAAMSFRRWLNALLILSPLLTIGLYAVGLTLAGHFMFCVGFLIFGLVAALNFERLQILCARIPALPALIASLVAMYLVYRAPASAPMTAVNVLFLPPLILASLLFSARVGFVRRFLETRWMLRIGRASYGLYLWQQLATTPVAGAGALYYVATLSVCLVFALVMFETVETRLIAWAAGWSSRLKARGAKTGGGG